MMTTIRKNMTHAAGAPKCVKGVWLKLFTLGCLGGFLLGSVSAWAGLYEKGGATGLGARAMGMAGAFSAYAEDETAVWWNPAGLGELDTLRLNSSLDSLYDGRMRAASFSAGYPLPANSAAGFAWQHMYYPQATQVNSDLVELAGCLPLTEDNNLYLGAGLKMLFGQMLAAHGDYQGLGMDIGLRYKYEWKKAGPKFLVGVRIQDIDTRIQWANGLNEQIPQSLVLGTALQWDPATVVALEYEMIHSGQETAEDTRVLRLGGERWFKGTLGVRAGYLLDNHRLSTFSLGAGLRVEGWEMEYALLGQVAELGLSHRLSLSYGLPFMRAIKPTLGPVLPMPKPEVEPPSYQLSLAANPPVFSPNRDGVADTTVFSLNILQGDRTLVSAWRLSIENPEGAIIRYYDGAGVPESITWDGLDGQEKLCADGTYTARLLLADTKEQRLAYTQTQVVLLTHLPHVRLEVEPAELAVIGGLAERKVIFHPMGGEQLSGITWELTVRDRQGTVYKTLNGQHWLPKDIVWAVSPKPALPAGILEAQLVVKDAAGNQSVDTVSLKITRIDPEVGLELKPKIISPGDPKTGRVYFTLKASPKAMIIAWELGIQDVESNDLIRILKGAGAPPETLTWDAKDDRGALVKGGLYFQCRLRIYFKGNRALESEPKTMASDVNTQDSGRSLALYLTSIAFEKGSYSIPLDSFRNLQQAAETIKRYAKHYRVQVKGYTDNQEAKGRELELSRARAQRVTEYLTVPGGIPAEFVESIGYGTFNPLAPETTPSGQAKNRRVEVVLIIQK
jgi:outer membrane protein OmpA-like peptidoglycan-associated protein